MYNIYDGRHLDKSICCAGQRVAVFRKAFREASGLTGTTMKKIGLSLLAVLVYASAIPVGAAPAQWVEGTNYVVLDQAQPTTVPAGKVEVMEVFSYGCPFCNKFQPVIHQLEHSQIGRASCRERV